VAFLLLGSVVVGAAVAVTEARLPRADFVFNNGQEVTSLDPAAITGQPEMRVLHCLYEGLTVKDPATLEPLPAVAESWDVSPDGLRYTFHLRPARWSNGDPLTAADFAWSWRRLLAPETGAQYAYQLWCVRGARAFSLAERELEGQWAAVGLDAPDERTLEVELERPTPYFLALTSSPPLFPVHRASLEDAQERFPDSWQSEWLRPGRMVSNGPFCLVERRLNDRLRLERNREYWDFAHVAFASMDVLAIEHPVAALNLYLAGEIDWIERVPTSLVTALRTRDDFHPTPYLGTYFYRVNTTHPPFDDARVRRALALAIDRRAICEKIMKKGERPSWSLTPEGFAGYPRPELAHAGTADDAGRGRSFASDLDEARRLLAEAGFGPRGAPLPPLTIHFNSSETHRDIAEVVGATWTRVLGVPVHFANEEGKVYLDTQCRLDYDVSRSSWIGDYPDPNTFLEVFVGGGENNRTGWANATYDELVRGAANEPDPAKRLAMLAEAEALLLEELPILPVFGYVSQNLVSPRLDGFHENLQDEHPPKFFRWRDAAEGVR
jgi:oligopeptide transport system substrate-binding protein